MSSFFELLKRPLAIPIIGIVLMVLGSKIALVAIRGSQEAPVQLTRLYIAIIAMVVVAIGLGLCIPTGVVIVLEKLRVALPLAFQ